MLFRSGPSQIYFDKALGKYRGKRHEMPLVQIASNSETQSMDMLRVANSQWGREASAYYGLDKGLKSTTVKDSAARMEVLTASERSAEGDPATFIALNETHHMTKESVGIIRRRWLVVTLVSLRGLCRLECWTLRTLMFRVWIRWVKIGRAHV